jgi:heat shock protein HslJ
MRSRWVANAVVLVLLVIGLGACGGDGGGDPSGQTWALTELNGQPPLEGTAIDMTIVNQTVSGSSGCNQYTGGVTVGSGTMSFDSSLASTQMACAEPIMDQEQVYLGALVSATNYEISGDELRLEDADGTVVARFE